MKKFMFLMITTIILAYTAKGQESAGASTNSYKSFVGGDLSFNFSEIKYGSSSVAKTVSFSAMPTVGIRVGKNLVFGFALKFTLVEDDIPSGYYEYSNDEKSLGLTFFLRTHTNLTGKLKLYYEPIVGRTFHLLDDSQKEFRDYFVGMNFGMVYFVKDHLSIEVKIASAKYEHISIEDSDYKANEFDINYDIIQPNLGLKFYF